MDTTECLGLPYPQCDPPLVKDASDVEQFRDLAEAIDAEVQELDDDLTETLFRPPHVHMSGGQNIAGTDITHFPSSFDWGDAAMADLDADTLEIQEDGWYMIGGYMRLSGFAGTVTNMRIEPLLNGAPFTARQGPGCAWFSSEDVTWSDSAFFRAGDRLTLFTHHTGNPATVATYTFTLWALQVLTNV